MITQRGDVQTDKHYDSIIIGAGIAGLSAAIRLAKQGYPVEVFEKHGTAGGSSASFSESGFTFDVIPNFLIMPSFIKELFDAIGEDMEKHLSLRRMPVHYKMFYPDGQVLTVSSDHKKNEENFAEIEEKGDIKYKEFLSNTAQIYQELQPHLYHSFSRRDILHPDFLRLIYLLKPFRSLYDYASRYFESDKLRWAFSFHALFFGINPQDAPGSYIILPYLEHTEYVYYPQGGIDAIKNSLHRLAENCGVKFHFNCNVGEIVYSGKAAKSIQINKEEIYGDVFISNVDMPYTQEVLLKRAAKQNYNYSFSGIQFFWGLKERVRGLEHHNFFVPGDLQKTLTQLFNEGKIPDDLFVYVSLPSLTDNSLAPPQKDCLSVFIPVPGLHKIPEIPHQTVKELRGRVLDRLSRELKIDLNELIEFEHRLLPEDYARRYNMKNGAIYGLTQSLSRGIFFRQPNFDAQLENLFYVGASVQPGNSLPLLIASGKIGADLAMKRRG